MMKLHLITGFLGSGKTTFLQHVLATGVRGEKVAVVVNELGEVGIDGAILEREGYALTELTDGCICCEVRGDLVRALMKIARDEKPDRVLIETTGAAEPGKLLNFLFGSGELLEIATIEPVVAVVDAANFHKAMFGPIAFLTAGQIKAADLILLNKLDLAGDEQADGVRAKVTSINPRAVIVPTTRCRVDLDAVLAGIEGRNEERLAEAKAAAEDEHDHEPGDHEPHTAALGLGSFVFTEPAATFTADAVEKSLGELPAEVFRLKGYVRTPDGPRLINFVTGTHQWHPAPERAADAPTELVVIGRELDEEAIRSLLARAAG